MEQPPYTAVGDDPVRSFILQSQSSPSSRIQVGPKASATNTFVHKLYNMVVDDQFQHLIAWNYTGASFIVCNIMEFARDVLPKHFKHNNFSSFVRQLNMYGFHKVNKSPRGHRTLAENQIWEFSHSRFLRDRPDLLDDIKRKTMESDTVRRETDLQAHMAMMQVSQSDMLQQINHLYDNFSQIVKELHETKQKQEHYNKLVNTALSFITQQNGGQLPHELGVEYKKLKMNDKHNSTSTVAANTPSIFVTTHDQNISSGNSLLQTLYTQNRADVQPLLTTRTNNPLLPSPSFGASLPPHNPSPTILQSKHDPSSSYYSSNNSQVLSTSLSDIMNSPKPTHQQSTTTTTNSHSYSFMNQNNTSSNLSG